MKKVKYLGLFEIVVFLDMIYGAYPWFFWNIKPLYINVIFSVLSVIYAKANNIRIFKNTNYVLGLCVLYLSTLVTVDVRAFHEYLYPIFVFIPLLTLVSDKKNGNVIFEHVTKWFSWVLIPSIILHLIFLVIGFPSSALIINEKIPDSYVYFNYFILVKNIILPDYEFRFCSIFLEPGYLGTLLAFLLYVGKYDFRVNHNRIFTVALLLTMSLAGYVVFVLGWILSKLQKRQSVKKILYITFVLWGTYIVGVNYNNGNNYLNENIISRLKYDEDKGISGNNRNSYTTDLYFDEYLKSGDLILGVGSQKVNKINGGSTAGNNFNDQIRGAGYKIYFITNGIIQSLMILFGYILLLRKSQKRYMYGFLLLIILTFIQASYPLSTSWLIPFIFACILNPLDKNENRNINFSSCS